MDYLIDCFMAHVIVCLIEHPTDHLMLYLMDQPMEHPMMFGSSDGMSYKSFCLSYVMLYSTSHGISKEASKVHVMDQHMEGVMKHVMEQLMDCLM